MKHLEDEDIARLIEGKISKKERENFLKHLSQCETCLTLYSETLKFVEEDKKEKTLLRFPNLKELAPRVWQAITASLPARRLIPAAALLLILLVTVPFLLNRLSLGKIEKSQIGYIKEIIEHDGIRSFSGSGNKVNAAVRAGIFVQDLAVVVNAGGEPGLQTEITRLLSSQLKPFIPGNSPLILELAHLEKKSFEAMVQRIRGLWERESLAELFDFGSFLEHGILSTFAGKQPQPAEIEKYRRILLNYQDRLAPGVFKELDRLKPTTSLEDIKRIFSAIAEIFLSLE